ncbi:MAG: alpha/beta hydrolase [Streptosporangiales bacterium]|nr:alpha/beta hydrolase [Streptosporangiales bacterium]MBO0891764.1 alpha/beta hydrolase [Acidothermales bacterium]
MTSAAATLSESGAGSRTPRWAGAVSSVLGARRAGAMELGAATHDTVIGTGPDVVVVPGLGVSRYLERAQRLIARRARVHRLELPGTADGDQPGAVLTLAGDAAAVISWLREHTPDGAVLVGHSYGTQVAARVAAAVPRLVRGLVLASPTLDPAYRHLPVLLVRWRMDDARAARGLAETNRPQQRGTGARRIAAMAVSMLADDIETSLRRVSAPVTIMRGERDALATERWVRHLAATADADYLNVPGNHTFPFDRPEELAAAVVGQIEEGRP